MTYYGPKVMGNFKNPNKTKKGRAADKRPGMDPNYVALIRQLPSCISGQRPCDPHHLRIKGERGVGLRATDRWCLPLTREEHMEVHRVGSRREEQWFLDRGVQCHVLARALWNQRQRGLVALEKIIEAHHDQG